MDYVDKNRKNTKVLAVIMLSLILVFSGTMFVKYEKEKPYKEMEEYIKEEDYRNLNKMFKNIAFDEENNHFGITKKEAMEVSTYFFVKDLYKEKKYMYVALHLKDLNTDLCWKFKDDAKKLKNTFFNSAEGKKWEKYWIGVEKKYYEEEKRKEELEKVDNMSKIPPSENMQESLNDKTEVEEYDDYNKTTEELIEEYLVEYDVYEYSDADEFYYDHKEDFEGYEDAEQYYEDAWSLIDEKTEHLIR